HGRHPVGCPVGAPPAQVESKLPRTAGLSESLCGIAAPHLRTWIPRHSHSHVPDRNRDCEHTRTQLKQRWLPREFEVAACNGASCLLVYRQASNGMLTIGQSMDWVSTRY